MSYRRGATVVKLDEAYSGVLCTGAPDRCCEPDTAART